MKIGDKPPVREVRLSQAAKMIGVNRRTFISAGVSDFLDFYQAENERRLYVIEDVEAFAYYVYCQRGLAALGLVTPTPPAPVLPPGETMKDKRRAFEAWMDEDLYGTQCPRCWGVAVRSPVGGPTWCGECGIVEAEK